jgi:putative copper resistance protein D
VFFQWTPTGRKVALPSASHLKLNRFAESRVTDPIILARAVHIAASALAAGTVCFMPLVAEPAFGRRHGAALAALRARCNLMVWSALAVAIISGAAWLALLAADIFGEPVVSVCLHGGLWQVLTGTRFGTVWSGRLAIALLLALMLVWPALRWLQVTAAVALIALLAFIGHAGATPGGYGQLHLVSDVVHLTAAGAWLGGLPALALLLAAPRQPKGLAARAASRFSVLGIVSVGALLASGLINSWNLLSGPRDLITTGYGQLLLLKVGLFAAMLGVAAVNRFHLTPRLKAAGARHSLMRNSLAETGLGFGVVLLVGALGTMQPTAHNVLPPTDIPADAAFVHIHSEKAMADVTIDPGRAGPISARIRVLHEDSSEFPANEIRFALDPPAPGPQPVDRAAVRQPDGTWQVEGIALEQPGNWIVRVIINAADGRKIVLDAPIVIAPAH